MNERDLLASLDRTLGQARYTLYKLRDIDEGSTERMDGPLAGVVAVAARRIRTIDRVAQKAAKAAFHLLAKQPALDPLT